MLPASTPDREAGAPLPATGPYMIGRYVPGRELRFVRNPYFREWSGAAQPNGYPDEIALRPGLSPRQAAATVASSTNDFMANFGALPPGAAASQLHDQLQVRINPNQGTAFLSLNETTPPFNSLAVRRALNLALDSGRIVTLDGGPAAARPTCQILPPQLPGYRPYCPYTRDRSPDGRWQAPTSPSHGASSPPPAQRE